MTIAPEMNMIGVKRHFTTSGVDPYDLVDWELRTARIDNPTDGSVVFEQRDVEVPRTWSQNATNILAQKYFRGALGTPEREHSLKQVCNRVVDTIAAWGDKDGYFDGPEEVEAFVAELKYLIITQRAAFNSPVWFNIGVLDVPQQASACFILSVDDTMDSILNWYTEEGTIFKGGSGAGVNLSSIRASSEPLKGGGTASGPVSFMRGADASAGTIKSGGKTRRAAKMVILNADHPDIEEFIWCKAREERKARALREAGFDMSLDGADSFSVQYQNANNSVRVTDEFMWSVVDGGTWDLTARHGGQVLRSVDARGLFRQIAEAAWDCADPGIQFDTTINNWHTTPNAGRINGSNPCSEYMHIDNSACNLASLNLLKFLESDGGFKVEDFKAAVEPVFVAQDILVSNADYPTPKIAENSRRMRELGLGYANLGAAIMAQGMPYDSPEAGTWAGAVTALMTGHAYRVSARMAARLGPFAGYHADSEGTARVLSQHRQAVAAIDEELVPTDLLSAAQEAWDTAVSEAEANGVRNSQATVLAPTGTIGLLMDCDTTGIEPDLGLVKTKRLVGGGTMSIVNQTVGRALERLGYSSAEADQITAYIDEHKSIMGAPGLQPEHLPVFACSMGDNAIHYMGHVRMMAAVQPFISGAISKTVNMPEDATVEQVEELLLDGWRMGLKAIAIYRDNCKVAQPLSVTKRDKGERGDAAGAGEDAGGAAGGGTGIEPGGVVGAGSQPGGVPGGATFDEPALSQRIEELERLLQTEVAVKRPVRERLPRRRHSATFAFRVADCEGYVTVGEYDDRRPGEVFMKVSKQGSTLSGIMDAFSISVSLGLQHGVPLATYVRKFTNMRFEPAGITDDADLRIASSLVDYIFRRLALDYLSLDERQELGILSTKERTQPTLPGMDEVGVESSGIVEGSPGSASGEVGPRGKVAPAGQEKTVGGEDGAEPGVSAEGSAGAGVSGAGASGAGGAGAGDAAGVASAAAGRVVGAPPSAANATVQRAERDAPMCYECGNAMQRSGSCYVCTSCGTTSGCS